MRRQNATRGKEFAYQRTPSWPSRIDGIVGDIAYAPIHNLHFTSLNSGCEIVDDDINIPSNHTTLVSIRNHRASRWAPRKSPGRVHRHDPGADFSNDVHLGTIATFGNRLSGAAYHPRNNKPGQ